MKQLLVVAGVQGEEGNSESTDSDESFDSIADILDEIDKIVESYQSPKSKADASTEVLKKNVLGTLIPSLTKKTLMQPTMPKDEQPQPLPRASAMNIIQEQGGEVPIPKETKTATYEPGPVQFKEDPIVKKELQIKGNSASDLVEDIDRRISNK